MNIINFLERYFVTTKRNPFLTLYVNWRLLGFKKGMKFPIWIYGWPKILNTTGKIVIDCEMTSGLMRVNRRVIGRMAQTSMPCELSIAGTLYIHGRVTMLSGSTLAVRKGALVEFGNDVLLSEMATLTSSWAGIKIGNHVRITHRCQIMDSSFHYMVDFNNRIVKRISRPVTIGDYCWICNSSTISPGSIIPNNTIVASNSVVNKDYSNIPEMSIIAGIPAKLVKSGVKRVWYEYGHASQLHKMLDTYFNNNPDLSEFPLPEGFSLENCEI